MGADGDTALIISAAALAGALLVLAVIHIAVMRQQRAEKLSDQLAQALARLDEGDRSGSATVGGVDGTPPRNRPIRRKKKKPSRLMVQQKQIYAHAAR